jgi:hypothetical protein
MKSSSRWLLISGTAIGILIIAATVLALTMTGEKSGALLPADTPEGTVQRFFLALKGEDYAQANSYLTAETQITMSLGDLNWSYYGYQEKPNWQVTLGKSTVTANEATMDVVIDNFRINTPFDNPIRSHTITFHLRQQENLWKIYTPNDLWQIFGYY